MDKIRVANAGDAPAVLNIYAPFIVESAVSFEAEVPSIPAFQKRMEQYLEEYPFLVLESDGKVSAFAYASKHRERAAYKYGVDLSIYFDDNHRRKGCARRLYDCLFDILKTQNYYVAYAICTLPNDKSESFHKNYGFKEIGVFKKTGFKFGRWHDVAWFEKEIQPRVGIPKDTIAFPSLSPTTLDKILDQYNQ